MNKQKRIAALLLALTLLVLPALSLADEGATITGNSVNLRQGASIMTKRLTYLNRGDRVTVTGKSGDWYAVRYGDLNGYVYGQYVSVDPPKTTLLRMGSRGTAVKELQGDLILLGYLDGNADGIFGRMTDTAVRKYQRTNGLSVDGIVGAKTAAKIDAEVEKINTVIRTAKSFLGMPYVYGGSSPSTGFDCSGLTQYAFKQAGITIPRVSYEQAKAGRYVSPSEMRPGDLVAFNSPVSHVGIYLGNGEFIHSPHTGDVIKITKLKYMNLTGVRRFTGAVVG